MEWITRLNSAMHYLEEHLAEDVDYKALSTLACCSTYHFQRMFTYMAGVPLAEYIRRRRMTLAAVDLQSGTEKIVDIALKYGYASPTAFNRAFQSVHGVAPSLARTGGVPLKAFPPISFTITIQGAVEMEYRIEKKNAFRIVGRSEALQQEIEKNFAVVPNMWQKAAMDGTLAALAAMMDGEPKGMLGVSACNEAEKWRYYIAVASNQPLADTFEAYLVPAATWAIFPGSGSGQSIQELEKRIVTEWLPSSGYEYANAPDIEVYLNPDPQNATYEVWIPVTKSE
ncbi:MAG: AraC family transcriptional regulator [Gemmiger sp.]|nr:AraC family transcriptional regulator [Gemmiger sp.]